MARNRGTPLCIPLCMCVFMGIIGSRTAQQSCIWKPPPQLGVHLEGWQAWAVLSRASQRSCKPPLTNMMLLKEPKQLAGSNSYIGCLVVLLPSCLRARALLKRLHCQN